MQAMFEFQRMLDQVSFTLELQRKGKFWELWHVGDDPDYHLSCFHGEIKINPQGAIRAFVFHGDYSGRSVLHQLLMLLDRLRCDISYPALDLRADLRPHGSVIDVDVIAIEDSSGYVDDKFVEQRSDRVVGRFAYDPAQELLLHRAS